MDVEVGMIEETLPYGWAGTIMVNHNVSEVWEWCLQSIENTNNNCVLTQYNDDLCQLTIRKKKDFMVVQLRWA